MLPARDGCPRYVSCLSNAVTPLWSTYADKYLRRAAWYDETTQYQREDTELEKTLEEKTAQRASGGEPRPGLRPRAREPDTEWQRSVKQKKNEEYYNKLQELENEQVVKESRLRDSSHQYAIPGEKIVASSVAKGMAQKYEDTL